MLPSTTLLAYQSINLFVKEQSTKPENTCSKIAEWRVAKRAKIGSFKLATLSLLSIIINQTQKEKKRKMRGEGFHFRSWLGTTKQKTKQLNAFT